MPIDNSQCLIGFDVGTTAVKGAVYDLQGTCIAYHSISYPTFCLGQIGWVEQNPDDWVNAIRDISFELAKFVDPGAVLAVGIVSQVNTHAFVDADGKPLMNAIVWQDQRCAEAAESLDRKIDDDLRKELWGEDFKPDSSFLMSRAEWLSQSDPDLWARVKYILSPKDYCLFRLTGEGCSDAISSISLTDQNGIYLYKAFDLIDGLSEKMPRLLSMFDLAGTTNRDFVFPGIPAYVSTMDAWGAMFGSGAYQPGKAFQASGTSEIIGAISGESNPGHGVISFPPVLGAYMHAGPTQLGGEAAKWFSAFFNLEIEEFFHLAEQAAHMELPNPLLFMPHIMGERAPLWDPYTKGSFLGINRQHKKSDMALAVLEGVGFSAKMLLESVELAAGLDLAELRISGGGSRSDLWCQIKADISGKQLERIKNLDSGTFGAALIAGVGLGTYSDISEAAEMAVHTDRVFTPNPQKTSYYSELYGMYKMAYGDLKSLNAKFDSISL